MPGSIRYISCCECGKNIKHEEELHEVHQSDCFSSGHFNAYEIFDIDELEEMDIECSCTIMYAHAECCPSCIDLGYDPYEKYYSNKESSDI